MSGRFVRVAERGRRTFPIVIDGAACEATEGDTVLVASDAAKEEAGVQ
jgi:hypothetical protein